MGEVELLILKNKEMFVRYKNGEYTLCGMDKASVFPLSGLPEVRRHLDALHKKGFPDASIGKLLIQEVPFDMDERNGL